jgi:hypothetical protein
MNVRNRRVVENILLRRVRRHQSMTALFRVPGMDSERPRQSRTLPIVQKKEEQDFPVDTPVTKVSPSLPVSSPRSDTLDRQVVAPSTSAPDPLTPLPSTPPENQPSKTPDPVWKRLQTIFRKHEEQNDPHTADTTDLEAGMAESIQPQVHKEKAVSQTTEEPVLPTRNQDVAIPAARTVQHFSENVEPKSELKPSNVLRKAQPHPQTNLETTAPAAARDVEVKPTLPDKTAEVNDQASADNEREKPSLPLESVWNVQRIEASHPLFREGTPQPTFDSADVDEDETSMKTSRAPDQKLGLGPVQLHREDGQPDETRIPDSLSIPEQGGEPRKPVEILSPSRPRPPQVDLPPAKASIQRQSQDSHASKEVSEASPVNTVIGPLPADLWWLLGQKPPSAVPASQPDIQRTIQPDQKQLLPEQSNIANSHTPAEQPVEAPAMPSAIQRQMVSNEPLQSSQQGPASPTRAEEIGHMELPDLDDLARRVYAEVRRRLAAEWERRR